MRKAVVVLPGMMGSKLYRKDEPVWPGRLSSLVLPFRQMDQLLEEDLEPRDIIRRYWCFNQYDSLLELLRRLGFKEDSHPKTLYCFPYDWRKRNEIAADRLASLLDQIQDDHHGKIEVSLIGHSMGALIARYYLESLQYRKRPGISIVKRLIMIGAPHRGAPIALSNILGYEKILWLNPDQVKMATNDPRFPSTYQLLSPKTKTFKNSRRTSQGLIHTNVFDPKIARDLHLSIDGLEAAKEFHGHLDPSTRPTTVSYFCFSGTRQKTYSIGHYKDLPSRLNIQKVLCDDGGDGIVPRWSSVLPGIRSFAIRGEHRSLYKNRYLQRLLPTLLGVHPPQRKKSQEFHSFLPRPIDIVEADRVVLPGEQVNISIESLPGQSEVVGKLQLQEMDLSNPDRATGNTVTEWMLNYRNLIVDRIRIAIQAPLGKGIYRIAFYRQGIESPVGVDVLFVQEQQDIPLAISPRFRRKAKV